MAHPSLRKSYISNRALIALLDKGDVEMDVKDKLKQWVAQGQEVVLETKDDKLWDIYAALVERTVEMRK